MKKFQFTQFKELFVNFAKTSKEGLRCIPLLVIFLPLSFVYLIALQALYFVKTILEVTFSYLPDTKDEHIAYRVTSLLVLSFLHCSKIIVLGAMDVPIFILGFFYDLTNKIMTLNKSTSVVVDF